MRGRITDFFLGYDGKQYVSLEIDDDMRETYEDLKQKDIDVKIKKWSDKRSLDANAYFWVLADKVAAKTGKLKLEYYRQAVKDIGGNSTAICIQNEALSDLIDGWEHNGLGWVCDIFPSKIEGCTNVILYYGSSTYDKDTMARLINYVLDDCREYNIETKSQEEIDSILTHWGGRIKESKKC